MDLDTMRTQQDMAERRAEAADRRAKRAIEAKTEAEAERTEAANEVKFWEKEIARAGGEADA